MKILNKIKESIDSIRYSPLVQSIALKLAKGSKFLAKFGLPGIILLYIIKFIICALTGICII